MKNGILLVASIGVVLAYAGSAEAKSIKSQIPRGALSTFCGSAGLGEQPASFTRPDGTVITGTIHCEAEDVAAADDQGQNVEPGDDHGHHAEAGDDHGDHGPGNDGEDNSGPGSSNSGSGGGDDGAGHDGGDDHGGHGGGND